MPSKRLRRSSVRRKGSALGILTLSAACNASQAILESAHSVVIDQPDHVVSRNWNRRFHAASR
jgi:hypothetical protein